MSREKQIEEMAKFVCNACEMGGGFDGECANDNDYRKCGISTETATALYEAGYRKASEVAREVIDKIFEEIEKVLMCGHDDELRLVVLIAELKKKYTGEANDEK